MHNFEVDANYFPFFGHEVGPVSNNLQVPGVVGQVTDAARVPI